MPVSEDYAARTACRDHSKIYTGEARGSMRHSIWSHCEYRRTSTRCKFSHTIFNTKRVLKLGSANSDMTVALNYGYGFERYGFYEMDATGWEVMLNGAALFKSSGTNLKAYNLPKSLLLAELKGGLTYKGAPDVTYEKVQSICPDLEKPSGCKRRNCRYDHDLFDARRIESLVRWPGGGMFSDTEYLTVQCQKTGEHVKWKIIMKPEAFVALKPSDPIASSIPARPFSYEDESLMNVIRHMEGIVGIVREAGHP